MIGYPAHADPPVTLAERLRALNDNLRGLAVRLKDAIAAAVSGAIGEAVRDVLRRALGDAKHPSRDSFDRRFERDTPARFDDRFADDERDWHDDQDFWREPPRAVPSPSVRSAVTSQRWGAALRAGVQAGLFWLRSGPGRRPLLTTLAVALAAGVTGFLAGDALAAGVGVLASLAGLLLTAKAATAAGELATP